MWYEPTGLTFQIAEEEMNPACPALHLFVPLHRHIQLLLYKDSITPALAFDLIMPSFEDIINNNG